MCVLNQAESEAAMSEELSYEQAAVLCRVPEMPMEYAHSIPKGVRWVGFKCGVVCDLELSISKRLTPSAPLTPKQAGYAVLSGCAVEVYFGNGGKWFPARLADCDTRAIDSERFTYRVPPEPEAKDE